MRIFAIMPLIKTLFVTFIILLISYQHTVLAAPTIQLSAEEQQWLSQHPVIRVGVDADYAPYSFVSADSQYHGVAPDFFQQLGSMLQLQFEFVPGLSWPQILESAQQRSLDVIATAVQTPQRDTFLNFTDIYIPTPLVIMVRRDDKQIVTASDLQNKRVALVKGYSSSRKILMEYPSVIPYKVSTSLKGLQAVAVGKADAYVGVLGVNTFLASKYGISNLKVAGAYELQSNGQRMAVRKDWPLLAAILNKAIKAVPESKRLKIFNKWVPVTLAAASASALQLTEAEQRWLAGHKEIRLAIDPDFAPVEFIDERGHYAGISAEYVALLNKKLNINMRVVPGVSWSEALTLAKQRKIDVFAAITPTVERRQYLQFTQAYFKYPVVIYTRNEYPIISGISGLKNKKILVVKDYFVHETIRQNYPDFTVTPVESIRAGLSAVSLGNADAFIGDIATATFVIRKFNLTNLKIAAPAEIYSDGHAFAVRKDWPELASIIDKGLASITPQQHLQISQKWIEIKVEKFPRYWIWIALTAAGLALIFVLTSTFLRIQVRHRTNELIIKNQLLEKENHERHRAEQALIKSEQRLTQFFHATFEMVFFHDNGRILDANPAVFKITGYTPEEIIGRNLLEFVVDDAKAYVMEKMTANSLDPYEASIIIKNQSQMPVEIHAENIEINATTARVVGLHDITERKKHEAALQQAHDLLEVKVEERTKELQSVNEKLLELDALKSMFIASVSHELRTPLNSIIGFSGMMIQGAFGELHDKYKDYVSRIYFAGQHLYSLITDIIDISKIESGHVDIELSEFDLGELIAQAVNSVQAQKNDKPLEIVAAVAADISLYTDRKRLLQCLLNFLSNAIKYSEQGEILISATQQDSKISIFVRDNGIGISEDDMSRLFEPFERFDSHLRVKAGGTGLGLYLTKKIVTEMLRGEINVTSKPGKGSTFYITIPKRLN